MTKFEIGKQYSMRSVCDHNCVWTYEVVGRTDQTVKLRDIDSDKVQSCRISKKRSELWGAEVVLPLGQYSMCPVLHA